LHGIIYKFDGNYREFLGDRGNCLLFNRRGRGVDTELMIFYKFFLPDEALQTLSSICKALCNSAMSPCSLWLKTIVS
jgi:hypothetical protein